MDPVRWNAEVVRWRDETQAQDASAEMLRLDRPMKEGWKTTMGGKCNKLSSFQGVAGKKSPGFD